MPGRRRQSAPPDSRDKCESRHSHRHAILAPQHREAIVRSWNRQDAPTWGARPAAAIPARPRHRPVGVAADAAVLASLGAAARSDGGRRRKFAAVEVALEPGAKVSKEVKEVELEFSHRVLVSRLKPWLV